MPLVAVGTGRNGARSRSRRLGGAEAGAVNAERCADIRARPTAQESLAPVVLTTAVAVLGDAGHFLIAARTPGVTAPVSRLLPLALLAILAMVLPSIAGGPREGATAWVFASAGLGADSVVPPPLSPTESWCSSPPSPGGRARRGVVPRRRREPRTETCPIFAGRKEPPMRDRPYTLLSCCVSIDGYIGKAASRLLLSNEADFDRVDAVRASCDAILVGAATVRIDNPRLLVRSQARREERVARGLAESPTKVTVTRRAELDARADFFEPGTPRRSSIARARW